MKKYSCTKQEAIEAILSLKPEPDKPLKLVVAMHALLNRLDPDGKQVRLFKVYTDKNQTDDITFYVGILLDRLSVSKKYGTCVKLKGCGEDKAWRLAYDVSHIAENLGYPKLIEPQHYKYLTRAEIKENEKNQGGSEWKH